jgi:mitofilin
VENAKERLEKALKAQYDISVKLASATATVGQGDEANELVDKVCHTVGEYTAKFIEEEEEVNKVQESILKLIQERSKNETLSGEAVAIEVEKIKTEIEAEKQLEINRLLKNQQLEFEIAMNKKMADTLQEKDEQFKKELEYLEKELERKFSEELKDQLLMQNEAHRYHLNDSLMRQASELTEQLNSEFSSKLGKVMDDHQLQMAKALAHLKGIQSMIDTVAEAHDSSRRQKSVKAASDVLVTALVNINKDSDPLAKHSITQEISNLSEVAKDDPFIQTIISSLPQEALSKGISSEIGLKKRFERVKKICSRVALVPEEGGGLGMYLLSYLQSLLTIDMFHPKMIDLSRHDPQESSTFQLLYQAKVHLDSNDVETAVRLVNQLRGESRRVASDWLTEAVLYLEIKQAVMAITEYLAASNVTILQ